MLNKVTIKQKLMIIIMMISTISLLLAATLFTLFQVSEIRQRMVEELATLANVIGSNTQTSLAFNDPVDAYQILSDLKDNKTITHAQIFNVNGALFASYTNRQLKRVTYPFPMVRQEDYHEFKDNQLIMFRSIEDRNGKLGSIYLEANLDQLTAQIHQNLQMTVSIIFIVLLITYLLTSRLQRLISAPILDLSRATNIIKESQDYNVRVERNDYIEIKYLCDNFNSMLDQIQDREKSLRQLASYDSLTKLPNRKYFLDLLSKAISRAKRKSHRHAVLFMDLDRFKHINDSLGHSAGDELLSLVAKRLAFILRSEDTVARLGGDEYTILLQEIQDEHQAAEIAGRILDVMNEPFYIQGHSVVISPSIGIVIYPDHGTTYEVLIKNADTAMYQAKHAGGNNYRFFCEDMNIMAEKRQRLEEALRYAFINNEIILNFQPQVCLSSGRILGMEALCRWQKNRHEIILPGEFIPIAEETGLIIPLSDIVMKSAINNAKHWYEQGLRDFKVAINISARQFRQTDLFKSIEKSLDEIPLPTEHIEIEITEAAVMDHIDQSINTLKKIKDRGITIAIDDFGTGYSSLSYLKKFPIDKLKIDRSFIHDMDATMINRNIVRSIIELGHNLKLSIVAEGVETLNQVRILSELQCDIMQGFYFSKPVSAEEIEIMIKTMTNLYEGKSTGTV